MIIGEKTQWWWSIANFRTKARRAFPHRGDSRSPEPELQFLSPIPFPQARGLVREITLLPAWRMKGVECVLNAVSDRAMKQLA